MFNSLKPRPHLRKVLKQAELELDRIEYDTLVRAGFITINDERVENDRLDDGIFIVQVDAFGALAKFWVEVLNKKVVHLYVM